MPIPKALLSAGFKAAPTEMKRRLLISTRGKVRTGKSDFGLKAPGHVAVFNTDRGLEGMVEKYSGKLDFSVRDVLIDYTQDQKAHQDQFKRFRADFQVACHAARTVFLDTGTEAWELTRLAELGQLTQVAQVKYRTCNNIYRALIRCAYDAGCNLIVSHRVEAEFDRKVIKNRAGEEVEVSNRTGRFILSGFKDQSYLIQTQIEHYYDPDTREFGFEILDCKQNMALTGYRFVGEECTFRHLAMAIFPDTDEEDWV